MLIQAVCYSLYIFSANGLLINKGIWRTYLRIKSCNPGTYPASILIIKNQILAILKQTNTFNFLPINDQCRGMYNFPSTIFLLPTLRLNKILFIFNLLSTLLVVLCVSLRLQMSLRHLYIMPRGAIQEATFAIQLLQNLHATYLYNILSFAQMYH